MVSSLISPIVSIGTLASDNQADCVTYTSRKGIPELKPSPSMAA